MAAAFTPGEETFFASDSPTSSFSGVEVIWTKDGMKAALLINDAAHAVVDFGARRAYCRTNFPPPTGPWRAEARVPWDDALLAAFYEADA